MSINKNFFIYFSDNKLIGLTIPYSLGNEDGDKDKKYFWNGKGFGKKSSEKVI